MKYYYLNQNVYIGEEIPEGAIEITEKCYNELKAAKRDGYLLVVDDDGKPVALNPIYYKDRQFYVYNVDTIPEGAIEVTEAEYLAIVEAVKNGKMIDTDADGKPIAVDPYMYYCNGGFYDPEIHTIIPAAAVKITKEYWQKLIDSQADGKVIEVDETGYPVSVTPAVIVTAADLVEYLYKQKCAVAYGGVTIVKDGENYLFETTQDSITMCNSMALAMASQPDDFTINWKVWQGDIPAILTITKAEFNAVFAFGMTMINTAFAVEGELNAQVQTITEEQLSDAAYIQAFKDSATAAFATVATVYTLDTATDAIETTETGENT